MSDTQETPKTPPKSTGSPKQTTGNEPTSSSQPDQGLKEFLKGAGTLTDSERELLKELYIANGQDAFDAEAAAVGRLKQEEYLALPKDFTVPRVPPEDVGRGTVRDMFKIRDLAAIYYLNKQRAPAGENAIVYAMIRMEAVKMGWVARQKEVMYLPFDKHADALKELVTDLAAVRSSITLYRLAAFLVPLAAEHTFRTMGHHYITGLATEYQSRYKKTLKACLADEVYNLLQPANLFHHVLHWVSPERAYNVLNAQLDTKTLPDAMVIRASAPPAGWALVTTTAAVLAAMESANVLDDIKSAFSLDLDEIEAAANYIRKDVRKWHKAYFAYNVQPPTTEELDKVNGAREIAISFAPYAQGFIEGTLRDAALGQAQALKKHSELNPVARLRSARFFRALGRKGVEKVADLFASQVESATRAEED